MTCIRGTLGTGQEAAGGHPQGDAHLMGTAGTDQVGWDRGRRRWAVSTEEALSVCLSAHLGSGQGWGEQGEQEERREHPSGQCPVPFEVAGASVCPAPCQATRDSRDTQDVGSSLLSANAEGSCHTLATGRCPAVLRTRVAVPVTPDPCPTFQSPDTQLGLSPLCPQPGCHVLPKGQAAAHTAPRRVSPGSLVAHCRPGTEGWWLCQNCPHSRPGSLS